MELDTVHGTVTASVTSAPGGVHKLSMAARGADARRDMLVLYRLRRHKDDAVVARAKPSAGRMLLAAGASPPALNVLIELQRTQTAGLRDDKPVEMLLEVLTLVDNLDALPKTDAKTMWLDVEQQVKAERSTLHNIGIYAKKQLSLSTGAAATANVSSGGSGDGHDLERARADADLMHRLSLHNAKLVDRLQKSERELRQYRRQYAPCEQREQTDAGSDVDTCNSECSCCAGSGGGAGRVPLSSYGEPSVWRTAVVIATIYALIYLLAAVDTQTQGEDTDGGYDSAVDSAAATGWLFPMFM